MKRVFWVILLIALTAEAQVRMTPCKMDGSDCGAGGGGTPTFDPQPRNYVLAGPAIGDDAEPTFRLLTQADLPGGWYISGPEEQTDKLTPVPVGDALNFNDEFLTDIESTGWTVNGPWTWGEQAWNGGDPEGVAVLTPGASLPPSLDTTIVVTQGIIHVRLRGQVLASQYNTTEGFGVTLDGYPCVKWVEDDTTNGSVIDFNDEYLCAGFGTGSLAVTAGTSTDGFIAQATATLTLLSDGASELSYLPSSFRAHSAQGDTILDVRGTGGGALALGSGAGMYLASDDIYGSSAIAIGQDAMGRAVGPVQDIAIGHYAMLRALRSQYNVAVGSQALYGCTECIGNVTIGSGAGFYGAPVTNGENNVFIGTDAGVDVSAGQISNSIAIGYRAQATASNTVQIGNASVTDVYFGDGTATLHGVVSGGGGGGGGATYITPDPEIYDQGNNAAFRVVPGTEILELAPNTSFVVTRANALTSPPLGFTVLNSGLWASADTHSTTQYRFRMVSAGGNTSWDSSTVYVPGFYRTVTATDYDVLVRIHRMDAIASDDASYVGVGIGAYTSGTPDNKHLTLRAHIGYHKLYGFPSPGELHLNGMTPQIALTDQEQQDGVWVHLRKRGQSFGLSINKTNSTTPPTTGWVTPTDPHTIYNYNVPSQGGEVTLVFFARSYFTSPAPVLEVSYLQERIGGDIRNESGPINWIGADGWPDTETRLTIVDNFDLGSADAVVDDEDIRAVLARAVNQRSLDGATWTFSAVRSDGNPGADTFQAPGSVTVSGTGRYFGLFAEVVSTNRTAPGSLALSRIRIPVQ